MINIYGTTMVIVDSDALVGLLSDDDKLHERCIQIQQYIVQNNLNLVIPYSIVLEAATVLARIKNQPELTAKLLSDYEENNEQIDYMVATLVAKLYNPKTSKKNTPFDHYVLALAKKNNIKYIFSFDSFYKKNGLILMEDLVS